MPAVFYANMASPLGSLRLVSDGQALLEVDFEDLSSAPPEHWTHDERPVREARQQLEEYFCLGRRTFELELHPCGTPFQQQVWQALREIPYGETISYSELASRIGRPLARRAVGSANGKNPLPIIIPCHRVIAADGGLGGYSSGLARKKILLDLEDSARFGVCVSHPSSILPVEANGMSNSITVENQPTQARLTELGVRDWPIWTKEVSSFPWTYDEKEVCYFLEGEVVVEARDGSSRRFGKGDLVTFPQGLSCTWKVIAPVRKHYRFGD